MLLTPKNIKSTTIMSVVMALTLFFMRGFYSEVEITPINLMPYLLSASCGVVLAFLYLSLFPSQRRNSFLTFFIPGIALIIVLLLTGLANLWLLDELTFMLAFIFGGQEISKPIEKSL